MKIRKELWFGFSLMALIIAGTGVMLLMADSGIRSQLTASPSGSVRVLRVMMRPMSLIKPRSTSENFLPPTMASSNALEKVSPNSRANLVASFVSSARLARYCLPSSIARSCSA